MTLQRRRMGDHPPFCFLDFEFLRYLSALMRRQTSSTLARVLKALIRK